jgi:hypothetical protein
MQQGIVLAVFLYVMHKFWFLFQIISGWKCERRSMGMRLGRNSCSISALSGLHHCHNQQRVQTDSREICTCVQLYNDECKESNDLRVMTHVTQTQIVYSAQDFTLPQRCKWDICSSGMLRSETLPARFRSFRTTYLHYLQVSSSPRRISGTLTT